MHKKIKKILNNEIFLGKIIMTQNSFPVLIQGYKILNFNFVSSLPHWLVIILKFKIGFIKLTWDKISTLFSHFTPSF